MTEADIQRQIQKAASEEGCRLFRNNTGKAWVGRIVERSNRIITLENYRVFHGGLCVGSSDLIGWNPQGKFLGVEVKGPRGKPTKEQVNFIETANAFGCMAGVCRSVDEFMELLNGDARLRGAK